MLSPSKASPMPVLLSRNSSSRSVLRPTLLQALAKPVQPIKQKSLLSSVDRVLMLSRVQIRTSMSLSPMSATKMMMATTQIRLFLLSLTPSLSMALLSIAKKPLNFSPISLPLRNKPFFRAYHEKTSTLLTKIHNRAYPAPLGHDLHHSHHNLLLDQEAAGCSYLR